MDIARVQITREDYLPVENDEGFYDWILFMDITAWWGDSPMVQELEYNLSYYDDIVELDAKLDKLDDGSLTDLAVDRRLSSLSRWTPLAYVWTTWYGEFDFDVTGLESVEEEDPQDENFAQEDLIGAYPRITDMPRDEDGYEDYLDYLNIEIKSFIQNSVKLG